jgi:prephenate dehydratase
VYVIDIKEMAAVLRQDADEAAVVRIILDGLHPRERNRLVFCVRPRNFADLDNVCIYAHNITNNDHGNVTDFVTRRTASSSSREPASANHVSCSTSMVCYHCNKPGHIRRQFHVILPVEASSSFQPSTPA